MALKKSVKRLSVGKPFSDALLDGKFGLLGYFTVSVTTVLFAEGKKASVVSGLVFPNHKVNCLKS